MDFFAPFPTITYDNKTIMDTTQRVDFLKQIRDNVSLYQYITVNAGQRPEDIAQLYYGDATLFWIVLYLNDIIDPYYDWVLTDSQLYTYVQNKYGVENVYVTHHYETVAGSVYPLGTWVNSDAPFKQAITNFDYESSLNEAKRNIKILKNIYLPQVLSEYKNSLIATNNQ